MYPRYTPRISIIMPVYNAEQYLEKSIGSVLKQSIGDFELILVNDGSKDNSLLICQEYAAKDCRINVINQDNEGVSSARNAGLQNSTGEYITFLDADDWLSDLYLEELLTSMEAYAADCVCAGHCIVKKWGRRQEVRYTEHVYSSEDLVKEFPHFFRTVATAPWGKLYKKSIIDQFSIKFPKGIPYGEDTIFNFAYYAKCNKVVTSKNVIYMYNFTNMNSAMQKTYDDFSTYIYEIYKAYEDFFLKRNGAKIFEKIRISEQRYFFEWAVYHYLLSDYSMARKTEKINCLCTLFPLAANDLSFKYTNYLRSQDWAGYIKAWERDHWKLLIKTSIKKLLK